MIEEIIKEAIEEAQGEGNCSLSPQRLAKRVVSDGASGSNAKRLEERRQARVVLGAERILRLTGRFARISFGIPAARQGSNSMTYDIE